ncbi:hypothetical protein JEQ12_001455 [Ovis aries]|uniref:Ribosomal biogenesis factor n=1 Tax=Ovis aries TaxID=9940 RepID=A0A836AMY8_SHEEP|nr:hypothetical protein JEQ12_001455 [Ovis aries]
MAKRKLGGQKSRNVFHIASQKPLRLKIKQNQVNISFVNIQKELANFSEGLSLEPLQKQLISQQCHENILVNVDEATRLMPQL